MPLMLCPISSFQTTVFPEKFIPIGHMEHPPSRPWPPSLGRVLSSHHFDLDPAGQSEVTEPPPLGPARQK